MGRKSILILLALFLFGCSSVPEKREIQVKEIAVFEHKEIAPVEVPTGFTHDVKEYTDVNGKKWVLVDPADLYKIKQAYVSAEQNAELVKQLNIINMLVVQRANLVRELSILEAYRAEKISIALDDERQMRREEQLRSGIESLSMKIITALALLTAL